MHITQGAIMQRNLWCLQLTIFNNWCCLHFAACEIVFTKLLHLINKLNNHGLFEFSAMLSYLQVSSA